MRFDLSHEQYALADAVSRVYRQAGSQDRDAAIRALEIETVLDGANPGALLSLALVAETMGRHLEAWRPLRLALARWLLKQNCRDAIITDVEDAVFALGDADIRLTEGAADEAWIFWQSGDSLLLYAPFSCRTAPEDRADRSRQAFRVETPTISPLARLQGLDAIRDALLILRAADAFGTATAAFEMTLDFVRTRRQFDRPIGAFQAVQHQLADLAVALDPCRFLWWRAAHLWDDPVQRERQAALAKAHVCDVALQVTRACVELHGAIGFTAEYPLHRHVLRAQEDWSTVEPPSLLRDRVAALAGW